jgi:aminoglycoside phosphotransferase (APT) family kinase protein
MKMHADEVELGPSLVRRLLQAQFPQWAALPISPVEPRGTDNALYRLGGGLVVRLPLRERTVVTLEKELAWLPRIAPFLPLPVPAPLATGAPTEEYTWTWAVYSWLDGENATPDRLADTRRTGVDLAAFIAALQRIDATGGPGPGEHNFYRGEPLVRRDAGVRASIETLREKLDVAAVSVIWETALAAPEWDRPGVWIHGDLDARNLLADEGQLSAVVDWGSLGVGDPACDVMVAWKVLTPEAREAFRAALSVDDATWQRARGWALAQALGALSYYTLETNEFLVREARRWLAEALTA